MSSDKEKWLVAQQHEKEYFDTDKNLVWNTPHSLQYWKDFLHIEKIEKRTIEIGCGPNGLYNFSELVIGLDSINYHKQDFVLGVGEHLPFKSVDSVICCNSLDHCQNPELVINEMFRVSNNFIVWSNIFPTIIGYLIRKFDKAHPYHFNVKSLKQLFKGASCTKQVQKSIYSWHGKNANLKGKLKLLFASLLGVKGICLHLEVKYNE